MIVSQITGSSLSERHKSLNNLISTSTFNDQNFKPVLAYDQIDNVFVAGIANKFKHTSIVCELLKSEDGLIVSKALKCKWFFDGVTCDVTNVDYFFTNLFPHVSFKTRCQIITQLSIHLKDCNIADQFYVKIKDTYGLMQAAKLLPVCSEQLIKDELSKDIKISNNKMLFIYNKYPNLVVEYIEENLEKETTSSLLENIEPILNFIVKNHALTFIKIQDKYYNRFSYLKYSYNASVLLLESVPLEKININKLNRKAVSKILNEDTFQKVVLNLIPNQVYRFPNDAYELIKLRYPKNATQYLITMFQLKYNKSFFETFTDWFTFVDELPLNQRNEWAKNMIAIHKPSEETKYVEYLECDAAIKRLMTIVQLQKDSYSRKNIVQLMINSCKVNNNMSSLLEVLKFVAKRFRNDDVVTLGFLSHFFSSFDLSQLLPAHLEMIDEMTNIQLMNYKIKRAYTMTGILQLILTKKIIYHLKIGKEVESIVDQMEEYGLEDYDLLSNDPDVIVKYLEIKLNRWKSALKDADEENANKIIKKCLTFIGRWNCKFPSRKIDIIDYDWLIEQSNNYFERDRTHIFAHVDVLFAMSDKTKKLFLKTILKNDNNVNVLNYALKYDPSNINIETIIKLYVYKQAGGTKRIFHKIKVYLNNTLSIAVKDMLNKSIDSKSSENNTNGNLVANLMMFSNEDQYESIINKHFSTTTKIDSSDEESKSNYVLMQPIVKIFRYLNPPPSYFLIETFAKDDYLKLILPSILSVAFRKNHTDTCKFINHLSSKAVSVNKHSIRLAYFHYNIQDLLAFYKKASIQKHNSIRGVVFNRTFKLLQHKEHPYIINSAWDIIKYYFESFNEKDVNLFPYLSKVDSFPDNITLEFCKVSWGTLKRLYNSKQDVESQMQMFLRSIEKHVDKLDNDFFGVLVDDYAQMSTNTNITQSLLDFFTCYIMMSSSDEILISRLNSITETYKLYILNNWNDLESSSRNSVSNFIQNCCTKIQNGQCNADPLIILNYVLTMLNNTLPFEAIFDLNMCLKLTIALMEVKNNNTITKINFTSVHDPSFQELLNKFSIKLVQLLTESIDKYGSEIIYMFYKSVDEFLGYFYSWSMNNNLRKLSLIDQILTHNNNRHALLLVCYLLPIISTKKADTDDDVYANEKFERALSVIKENGDLTVKLIMNSQMVISSVDLFGPNLS